MSACSRIYIHEDIKEEFVNEISKLLSNLDKSIYGVIDESTNINKNRIFK